MNLAPTGARVTPLLAKLAALNTTDDPRSWYEEVTGVLRGGDGGEHGLLLYKLVNSIRSDTGPVILDIGTARGFSAIAMARALLDANSNGTVYTIDVVDHDSQIAWHGSKNDPAEPLAGLTISRSDIWTRWFAEESARVTPICSPSHEVLQDWRYGPIDIAFIDGDHTYGAVKRDLSLLENMLTPGGVIVLDDYHTGMCMGAFRSRPLNGAIQLMGRAVKQVWPSMSDRLSLGTGNEFVVVKRRYAGIYRAVNEFLMERSPKWALEVVSMPPRGDYHEADYSLALVTRRNTASA